MKVSRFGSLLSFCLLLVTMGCATVAVVLFTGCGEVKSSEDAKAAQSTEAHELGPQALIKAQVEDGYFYDAVLIGQPAWDGLSASEREQLYKQMHDGLPTFEAPLHERAHTAGFLARGMKADGLEGAGEVGRKSVLWWGNAAFERVSLHRDTYKAVVYLRRADALVHDLELEHEEQDMVNVAHVYAHSPRVCVFDELFCQRHPVDADLAKRIVPVISNQRPTLDHVELLYHHVDDQVLEPYARDALADLRMWDEGHVQIKYRQHEGWLKGLGLYPDNLQELLAHWEIARRLETVESTACHHSAEYAQSCESELRLAYQKAVAYNLKERQQEVKRKWRATRLASGYFKVGFLEDGSMILLPKD